MYKETQSFVLRRWHGWTDRRLSQDTRPEVKCALEAEEIWTQVQMRDLTTRFMCLLLASWSFSSLCRSKNTGKGRKWWKISSLQNSLYSLSLSRECAGWQETLALRTRNHLLSQDGTQVWPRASIQVFAVPYHPGSAKNNLQQFGKPL